MKIVTRSGVFETNSSSVHSYTCPIKSERISFKGWARSKADKDKVVNIDFDWWIDETGDVSPDNKLALVLSGIPAFGRIRKIMTDIFLMPRFKRMKLIKKLFDV
mgnify:CR=1 FL=1